MKQDLRRAAGLQKRHFSCKLAFLARLPGRHDTPWHFARTDIGCPRWRARKMYALARRNVAASEKSIGNRAARTARQPSGCLAVFLVVLASVERAPLHVGAFF